MIDLQGRLRHIYVMLSMGYSTARNEMIENARVRLGELISELDDGADWTHESTTDQELEGR